MGTFIQRRILPLQHRDRKICYMSGRMDPTRTSTLAISHGELYRQCRGIASVPKMKKWQWGLRAYTRNDPPPQVCFQLFSESQSFFFLYMPDILPLG